MSARTRGLGRVYRRGNVWWIQYSHRGRKYRESSGSTNRMDAVRVLRRRLEEMGRGRLVGPNAERVTFADLEAVLLDHYRVNGLSSTRRVETSLRHLREHLGNHHAIDITTDRINAYVRARLEEGASPQSVRHELNALGKAFRLAIEAGKFAHMPIIKRPKVDNTRTGFFDEPEIRALLDELPDHLQPVVEFAYLTGWRIPSEVLRLTWAQVDFRAGVVRLEPGTTKNRDGREFPFDVLPRLESLLREQRERTTALEKATDQIVPWVFHRNGTRLQSFYKAWHSALTRAATRRKGDRVVVARPELLGRIPHDLRRTAVRNLERAGVPRSVAMKLTGHRTENVYRRYAIVSPADLREGVARLAALHGYAATENRTRPGKGTVGAQSGLATG